MVQIIRKEDGIVVSDLKLYIPHGSDNTAQQMEGKSQRERLYIPHGSDNTLYLYLNSILIFQRVWQFFKSL